ncbi:MAG: hypothetical protein AAGE94_19760 [Acidobacteriota bacterium]
MDAEVLPEHARSDDRSIAEGPSENRLDALVSGLVLLAYGLLVTTAVAVHEPWFDEAQSWLLARDAGVVELLTERLRYEGHPPLWYLILKVPITLGLPYGSGNVIAAAFGVLGVGLLMASKTTPLAIRLLLPFSFFVAFQYAVIARSYALVFPILMAILLVYPRRRERILTFAALLILLSNVSLHGLGMAGALSALYALDLWQEGVRPRHLVRAEWRRHWLAALLVGGSALALVLMLKPPPDLGRPSIEPILDPRDLAQILANITASFLFKANAVSATVWVVLVAWFWRTRNLLLYALLTLANLVIASIYYSAWHEGLFFLALVFTLLRSFQRLPKLPAHRFDVRFRAVVLVVASAILLHHVSWTVRTLRYDIDGPFSGAGEMARLIEEHGLDDPTIRLYATSFPCIALQPYFDHNLFANYDPRGGGTFFDWSATTPLYIKRRGPLTVEDYVELDHWMTEQLAEAPDFVLVSSKSPLDRGTIMSLRDDGRYRPVATTEGVIFWKTSRLELDHYLLFQRVDPPVDLPTNRPSVVP